MPDQWEKYVEPAAAVLAPHIQVWRIWDHEERAVCLGCDWTSETEGHELSAAWAQHMASLAIPVIGPLIAEDTRERMVAAAARAVGRVCTSPSANRGDGRGCEDDHCPRHGGCDEEEPA